MAAANGRRVSYFFEPDIGKYHFGHGHPMKPHRVRMTHSLVVNYGLYRKMDVLRPKPASAELMKPFHADDYLTFLQHVNPDNMHEYLDPMTKYNLGDDSPIFDDFFEYCQLYASGSIGGAFRLNKGYSDVVVNWAGGMSHPRKALAGGFGYINDCVLAILELLKKHQRVLYVDIDLHHGDGVEEAFYTTDRVMTCSFHKFGDCFPGTGALEDTGHEAGKGYSVNVPLKAGIDDDSFKAIFEPVVGKIMEVYQPTAIVLQCGAASLTGDRLGCMNLTLRGHGSCVKFVKSFNVPLLVLGGSGSTIRNVAQCWAFETSILLDTEIDDAIPYNEQYDYYAPDYKLHLTPSPTLRNDNDPKDLEALKRQILENLIALKGPPSVPLQDAPPDAAPAPAAEPDPEASGAAAAAEDGVAKAEHPAEFQPSEGAPDAMDTSGSVPPPGAGVPPLGPAV